MNQDPLYHIVKCLSPLEKKEISVKFESERKPDKPLPKYFKLYDLYKSVVSKKYASEDKAQIALQKLINKTPELKRHIASVRKILKDKILLGLVNYPISKEDKRKLNDEIKIIEFLIQRKLFDEALHKIQQAKPLAKQLDLNKSLVEITDFQLTLLGKQSNRNDSKTQFNLVQELNHYQKLNMLELTFKNIYRELNLIAEKDIKLKQAENRQSVHRIYKQFNFNEFQVEKYKEAHNVYIVMWYYRLHSLYFHLLGKFQKAFESSSTLVNYFEIKPSLIDNFPALYLKSICSFTMVCRDSVKEEALEDAIYKVKQLYEKTGLYDILELTCDIGVLHHLNRQQYKKAEKLVDFIKKEWEKLSINTNDGKLLWYCHSFLVLFWVVNDEIQFEHWLNIGLNKARAYKGKDFYFAIQMFDFMRQIDNNDYKIFSSKLESYQKTLKNNENFSSFEEIVLSHFRKFCNLEQSNKSLNLRKKEKIKLKFEIFTSLKRAIEELKFKTPPINYLEALLWCESHLQNKTIKQVFEAEANKT